MQLPSPLFPTQEYFTYHLDLITYHPTTKNSNPPQLFADGIFILT